MRRASVIFELAGLGPSSPDVVGLLAPSGRCLCLEVKWPDTYPDAGQRAWLRAARSFGAVAEVVHSVEEALDVVSIARAGDQAREAARELLARCDMYVATEAEVDEVLRERRSDVLAVLRGRL